MIQNESHLDAWLLRLKRGYEAGYYKTEAALGEQEAFPWQNKSCRDCPFWLDTRWCQVHAEPQDAESHTCSYFDESHRPAAQHIVEEQQRVAQRRFWDWMAGHR